MRRIPASELTANMSLRTRAGSVVIQRVEIVGNFIHAYAFGRDLPYTYRLTQTVEVS